MKILGNVIKSQSDKRIYKAIQLKNQLQCLLISDRDSFKSSAALSVGVGSLQDPIEAQGLAHYLEHMLFMGTEKYPDENQYSNFIAKNCGISNAYTAQDLTNYHFQVASNAFEGTLDRFAQFFISPLMSDSSSERQLNAVHSQHIKNLQSDNWRKYQLSKHIAKAGHPLKKFSTGNIKSLSNPNLRSMLHNFYNAKYSANLMKLVVYSNQTPERLQKIVEEKFSEVPNKSYHRFRMEDSPYNGDNFGKIYKIMPVKDIKTLELVWTLPDKSDEYKSHPGRYLSHLFGHEGKGSLLSFLIDEGLAFSLSAYSGDMFRCYNQFQVSISLTKKGVQQYDKVINYTLHYLELLKNTEPKKQIFDEIKNVFDMRFKFQEKRQGMMFTSGIARNLQEKQIDEVLAYPYFMEEWRPDRITEYLSEMSNKNLMIFIEAKELEGSCSEVQPIYETKYSIENFCNLTPLSCPVTLPEKNNFIPSNFEIAELSKSPLPQKIFTSNILEGYFKKDHRFGLPKTKLCLQLSFQGLETAKQYVVRQIFNDMLNEKLRQFTYLAEEADISSSITVSNFNVGINISCFRDSLGKFTYEYLKKIMEFVPNDEKIFQQVKQKMTRALENYFSGDPFRMAYGSLQTTLRSNGISTQQKLNQITNIQIGDIGHFAQNWKKQIKVQSFLGGNIDDKSTLSFFQQLQQLFSKHSKPLPDNKLGQIRPIKLPLSTSIIQSKLKQKNQQNSSLIVHFQNYVPIISNKTSEKVISEQIRQQILQSLCQNFIKQPAFDYLRTKQQLGYIVMCLPDNNRGVAGTSILIQSAVKSSYQLTQYVDAFLDKIFKQKLHNLDDNLFLQYKNSMLTSKQEADKNLNQQTSRFWVQILKNQYIFDRRERELEIIPTITLQQFKNYVNMLFYLNPRRMEIHMISQNRKQQNQKLKVLRLKNPDIRLFKDSRSFRDQMELYPDFYSKL